MGRDPNESPQGLVDMLPEWMGYSFLYLVRCGAETTLPVMFASTMQSQSN